MSGELFVVVLATGFAAFIVHLIVQIVNQQRWAIPIAVGIGVGVLVIAAIFFGIIASSAGV